MKNKIVVPVVVVLITMNASYAYLDPGTTNMIYQAVVGVIGAGLIFGNQILAKLKKFFKKEK